MVKTLVGNGRMMSLIIAVIIVSGLGALNALPRTEDPRISNRTSFILTPFPGASAERVESLVTEPLENKVREIEELDEINSTSRAGMSVVRLRLKDTIYSPDIPPIWSRVRDLIAEVATELPRGSLPPRLDDDRGEAFTIIYSLNWQGPGEPRADVLGRYAKEVESRLRAVVGTELVGIFGAPEQEFLVEIDNPRLSQAGLTPRDVSNAVLAADAKVSAGQLNNSKTRIALEVSGELSDIERIRNIPLKVTASGRMIRIGDVASVRRQEKLPSDSLAIIDDQRAVVVAVRMLPNVRIDQWTAKIDRNMEEFQQTLPSNIAIEKLFDQNAYTQTRLGDLAGNVLLGFTLILTVLFCTLGWRSALIVAAALPLTALCTLSIMRFTGLPIHQMSVTGLIVSLGIMVDNAIVMTDAIAYERRRGLSAYDAVRKSLLHLWQPLLGSTLTTILTFMPIVLMPGPGGEFVGGIALSVIFSLIGSYVISHTIIAGLAGRFTLASQQGEGKWWQQGINLPSFSNGLKRGLRLTLKRPKITVLVVSLIPLAGLYLSSHLTEQFFPASDRDMFQIEVYLPQQASIDETLRVTEEISQALSGIKELEYLHWFVGSNAPSFYYNMTSGKDGSSFYAQGMAKAKNFKSANALIPVLQTKLDDHFPNAQILVRKLEQGPPVIAPIELHIIGPNLDTLKALGEEIRRIALETPDVIHTRATLSEATPKLWFEVREAVAQQSRLPLTALADQMQTAVDGITQGTVLESTFSLPVRVRLKESQRSEMAALENLNFVSPVANDQLDTDSVNGIPLLALGHLELKPIRGTITRKDGRRINTIEVFTQADVMVADVLTILKQRMSAEGFQLPPGYELKTGGQTDARSDSVGNLMSSVFLILTMLILVVVISFNSYRVSSIIFAVAIQAAGLGLLCVYLFNYAFSFTVIIALMGLIGLAINAAIVILAELKASPEAITGDIDAIIDSVMLCSRHITSTTITTVGGFMPLILEGGGFWPPFAIAIAGGTLLATLLSFFFVPAAFKAYSMHRKFERSGVPTLE